MGKAAQIDEVTPEIMKATKIIRNEYFKNMFNERICQKKQEEWNLEIILPIYKNHLLSPKGDFRKITLTSKPGKILARKMGTKVREPVEKTIEV